MYRRRFIDNHYVFQSVCRFMSFTNLSECQIPGQMWSLVSSTPQSDDCTHAACRCQHHESGTRALPLFDFARQGFAQRCRGACRAGGGQLSSVCGGPTSVFELLWGKMAEAAAVPPHRFFCHCCKGEVNPKLPVRQIFFSLDLSYSCLICAVDKAAFLRNTVCFAPLLRLNTS